MRVLEEAAYMFFVNFLEDCEKGTVVTLIYIIVIIIIMCSNYLDADSDCAEKCIVLFYWS